MTQFFALIVTAASLLSFVGGVMFGSRHANKVLAEYKAEVALANKVTEAEMARLTEYGKALEEQLKKRKVEIRTVTNEIVKEIPKLVGSGNCINAGWVRVHDAAAGVSVPAGEFVGPTLEVTAARAAEVVVNNYGECNVWREQLLGWQKWHGEESESKRRINNILRSAQ